VLVMVVSLAHTHSHAVLGKGEWYSAAVVPRSVVSEARERERDGEERRKSGG